MRNRRFRMSGLVLVMMVLGTALWVQAGNLEPPDGPIGPTMYSLEDVFVSILGLEDIVEQARDAAEAAIEPGTPITSLPAVITQCGSYFLESCLVGVPGADGIRIESSNVTLDLNGYTLIGVSGSDDGIEILGQNVTVRNGTIKNWDDYGIRGLNADRSQFENLRVVDNGSVGLRTGTDGSMTHCLAFNNGLDGIVVGSGSVVSHCTSSENGNYGIKVGVGSTISYCTAHSNKGGFVLGKNSVALSCAARDNDDEGFVISTGSSATVKDCTSGNNGLHGIDALDSVSTISGCEVFNNGGSGIRNSGLVSGCTARLNGVHGIRGGDGSMVRDCLTWDNTQDGIHVLSRSSVSGCTTYRNTSNGIWASFNCRIEGNHATQNNVGISSSTSSLVIRNTAASNTTNYQGAGTVSSNPANAGPWDNLQ